MKLKEIFYLLGLRPKPRSYGCEVISFDLPDDGSVEYATWLHPRVKPKVFEQDAVTALREFLRPGDVAVDVGAHTGDSTLPIALAVGAAGCVLALEPNPYVFPVLERNSELNLDKTHIVPLMFAATPSDGQIEFEYSDSGFCNGGRHEGISKWRHAHAFQLTVEGRNLENYIRSEKSQLVPRIRYIKTDAEGYDFEILKSISALIAEVRPFLKVEVFARSTQQTREAMIGFLEALGYEIHRVVSDNDYLGEPVGVGDVMRWRHYDIFCVPKDEV